MNEQDQRIDVDPGRYIAILESRLSEMALEAIRLRAVIAQMVEAAIVLEGEYQTDEDGELFEEATDER